MKSIIYVPGKNPKPLPDVHRQQLLRCLQHGLRRIDSPAADEITHDECFTLVAWNYLLYRYYRDISEDIPWLDNLLDREERLPHDIREVRPFKYHVSRLLYQVGDLFPWLIPLIPDRRIKSSIQETESYFKNRGNIACIIRDELKKPLRAAAERRDRVLLIAHSMGSVIAYDTLWELEHLEGIGECVDTFLTLGSPLGMRFVQKRLLSSSLHNQRRYPCNIRHWVNISSRGDLVALDPSLRDDFGEMLSLHCVETIEDMRKEIVNYFRDEDGLNVHRSYGYLVNPHVSRVISDWWTGMKPELIAHRGEPENYPENSLEGYRAVLDAGARYIETDIQISADGIPVLSHDPTLLKITGTELVLTQTNYSAIRDLPAGQPERFGERFNHLRIASLAEFTALLKQWPEAHAFIELKQASLEAFGVERVTEIILEALGEVRQQCIIISFEPEAVAHARKASGLPIGWVIPEWSEANRVIATALKPEYLFCNRKRLPPPDVALWRGPWKWVVYTVNDPGEARDFASRGIGMVETNVITSLLRQADLSGDTHV